MRGCPRRACRSERVLELSWWRACARNARLRLALREERAAGARRDEQIAFLTQVHDASQKYDWETAGARDAMELCVLALTVTHGAEGSALLERAKARLAELQ